MKRVLLALACAMFACQAAAEVVVISNDGGGNITEYRARREKLAKAEAVVIRHKCLSACAIFTTLPNACVMPGARIGFHGTTPKSGIPQIDYWLDMRMGGYFRGEVRHKFETEWRFLGGRDQFKVLTGRELAKLDPLVKLCDPKKVPK